MKRMVCFGGDPAGLYPVILFRKAVPKASVAIYELNQPGDTFRRRVVFPTRQCRARASSSATLHAPE